MSAPPWADAKLAVYNAFRDVWFVKNIRVFLMPPTGERACEALCQDLLFNMTREAGLLGVKPNHPWSDFASDFQYPDHPEDRIVSNIQRYAGNYLIVITLFALISSLAVSPGFFIFLIVLHCIPLFGPPEMFDVLLNLPASWGGPRDCGGVSIRLRILWFAEALLWVGLVINTRRLVLIVALLLCGMHAFFRKRSLMTIAKDLFKKKAS
mmetsp:Transcript_82612/g.172921  ORF Transcript_82612/g.172921 Transcript_82612/m.172921 type:complete len:209 (-) Transcript_82612:41-667(-)